jgi:glycosyltransferase involved in cell wall biosynthesis
MQASSSSKSSAARHDVSSGSALKVLHVLHGLHAGGMENGVVNLAHGQLEMGIVHHVCALTDAGPFANRLPEASRVERLDKPEGFSIKTCIKLRRLIQNFRPDVVHSHNYSGLIYSSLALLGTPIPLLAGEHAQLTPGEKVAHRLILRKFLYRMFCRAVHTVSTGQRDELLAYQLISPEAIHSLPNGVDTLRFRPQPKDQKKTALRLPRDCVLIGMVSRLAKHKRHDLLLEAFQELGQRQPQLHLAIVGDRGNAKEAILNCIASHPFKDRIHWLGMRDDLPDVYPAFDLLILPSESEGMSNVCLEAMACGVPVAANDSCGANEIIIDDFTGIIRAMPDSASVVTHLARCLTDLPTLHKWGQNARLHVEENFSITNMMARYESLYRSLLNR